MNRSKFVCGVKTFGLYAGVPFILALVSFNLFSPGVFSFDSFSQYSQAVSGKFTNDHPVILACLMRLLDPIFGPGGLLLIYQILYWLGCSFLIFALKGRLRYLVLAFLPFFICYL